MTIEAAQIRAGRALIGWSQSKLAASAGLSLSTVEEFESGAAHKVPSWAVAKMQAALESAGIAFIPELGGGAGVRFRTGRESKYLGWEELNASNDE